MKYRRKTTAEATTPAPTEPEPTDVAEDREPPPPTPPDEETGAAQTPTFPAKPRKKIRA